MRKEVNAMVRGDAQLPHIKSQPSVSQSLRPEAANSSSAKTYLAVRETVVLNTYCILVALVTGD